MASELRVDTLKDSSGNNSVGMSYVAGGSAKALAKIDTDAAVDESLNVSSATDNGTGNFSITLTNSMSSSVYIALTGSGNTKHSQANESARTTSVGSILNFNNNHSYADGDDMNFAMHGDLA